MRVTLKPPITSPPPRTSLVAVESPAMMRVSLSLQSKVRLVNMRAHVPSGRCWALP